MTLYRALSPAELADLQLVGYFRPGPPSYQGKWFAETEGAADEWGRRLFGQAPFHIVSVDVPDPLVSQMFYLHSWTKSDRRGMLTIMCWP